MLISSVAIPPLIFDANSLDIPFFDTAGKYGAGVALSVLGQSLAELNIDPDQIMVSNKTWLISNAVS